MRNLRNHLVALFMGLATGWVAPCLGQTTFSTTDPADWTGTWVAEGTFFTIAVSISDQEFRVAEVESMGFVWSTQGGIVEGDRATIEVKYAGATALVLARLAGDGLAVVEASSCMPEFMVVCALVKDRQAVFIRTATN